MTQRDKRLRKMRDNPKADWRIEQFKALAEQFGVQWRQPGTSHVTFVAPNGESVTVPSHKPVKPVYVRRFVAMLAGLEEDDA
jgi:predicted RNA binding protein YcfA (HicA-like mRNA interferase family)